MPLTASKTRQWSRRVNYHPVCAPLRLIQNDQMVMQVCRRSPFTGMPLSARQTSTSSVQCIQVKLPLFIVHVRATSAVSLSGHFALSNALLFKPCRPLTYPGNASNLQCAGLMLTLFECRSRGVRISTQTLLSCWLRMSEYLVHIE